MAHFWSSLLLLPLAVFTALATQSNQTPPDPCAATEQKQLSFWVGDWDLTWPGNKAGEIAHGTNSIKRILDGCVVQENFSAQAAGHLRGTSVSTFDANAGKWKQTWVDNEGAYLDFVGEFKERPDDPAARSPAERREIPAAHGVQKHYRQRTGLELGILHRRRQDLAGSVADPLQAQTLIRTSSSLLL